MFFNTTKEFGAIKSEFGDAIIVQSIDVNSSNDILLSHRESIKSFRSIPIFKFDNDSIFNSNFGEILPSTKANFYSVINDFIIFAEKEIIIENIISEFINNNVLSNDQNYKSVKNLLSDEASYVESLDPEALALIINTTLKTSFSKEDLREYKNSSFQVIKDDNVVHLNGLIKKNTDSNTLKKVQEQFTALIRSIGGSSGFRDLARAALDISSALISVADAAKSALPALTAIGNAIGNVQKESQQNEGDLIIEHWKRLAGIL